MLPSGNDTVFSTRRNVCLAWVAPEDVAVLLAMTATCCGGGRPKPKYRYATDQEVIRWQEQ